jgi:hypothetical protein
MVVAARFWPCRKSLPVTVPRTSSSAWRYFLFGQRLRPLIISYHGEGAVSAGASALQYD